MSLWTGLWGSLWASLSGSEITYGDYLVTDLGGDTYDVTGGDGPYQVRE